MAINNMINSPLPVSVADGGTEVTTQTAYGVICAGTTPTGPLQNAGAGTVGQGFTSAGAGVLPSFQALPTSGGVGGMVHLSTATASSSATVELTGMTGYSSYVIYISSWTNSVSQSDVLMQVSTDNGSTWETGASDYMYSVLYAEDVVGTENRVDLTASSILFTDSLRTLNVDYPFDGIVTVINPAGGFYTSVNSRNLYDPGASAALAIAVGDTIARYNSTTTVDAVRFMPAAGTIVTGSFDLFGII